MPAAATPRWQGRGPVPHPQLRVTDADRDQVVEHVKAAFAAGRLDKIEMDERLDRAMTARTHADLTPIMADLYGTRPAYVPPPSAYTGPSDESRDRLLGAGAHLLSLAGLFVIGPLIIMLAAGSSSPYVRRHAVEALNFHLTLFGATILLPFTIIGIPLIPVYWILWFVLSIVAGVSALSGGEFRYPLTIRLVK
ncbi:DUF1707 and DUF4870 domain-containing protein [Sphaerimonospora thailandensis]|uniref:DUF1707 domain-containing protein n=1 Tax=Sphaerimonospora thailandensis TaxID=795644 RepID=A0A8J3VZJ8_9ACTN|nr:DUF1707 and DUF4870 domain-containing protein [Sphaerimonospora thailandensis]GIH70175.1 hypothetical protein Mth01_24280 [Sphaerimonospora thailandensis]